MFQIEATVYPLSVEEQLALDAAVALISGPEETWVVAPGSRLLGAIQSHVRDSTGPVHIATLGVSPRDDVVQQLVGQGAEVFIVTDTIGLAVATAGGRVAYDALGAMICTRSGELALAIRERFAAVTEGLQPVALAAQPEPPVTPTPTPATEPTPVPTVTPPAVPAAPPSVPEAPAVTPVQPEPAPTPTAAPAAAQAPAAPVSPLDIPDVPVAPEAPIPAAPSEVGALPEAPPGETASWSGGQQAGGAPPA